MIVVIPALNPDEKLFDLVEEIRKQFHIVIVNDGSTVGRNVFEELVGKVDVVLHHEHNRGKGAALKTAFKYILENYKDVVGVVTADSDGQHTPTDIARVADAVAKNPQSLTLGVRAFSGIVPFRSRFGNSCTRFVFWLMTGLSVRDTQTGLRGIPMSLLPRMLEIEGDRHEYEMRMLADAKNHPVRPVQIPIETVYIEGNKSSHFNPIRDSIRVWGSLFHFCFSSIGAFFIDNGGFYLLLFITQYHSFGLSRDVLISLVVARFISANFQFFYNRNVTFKSNSGAVSYAKYWAHVVLIATLSYFGTNGLSVLAGITHRFVITCIKIVVETVLFVLSYCLQKNWVFKHRD